LSDCFILPSTCEPWGLVVNEAMACGLPVLLSNRCGCGPELVREGGNGFTFDPYDTGAIAERMRRVASLPGRRRQEMGAESRRMIARYTPPVWAENLAQCLRAVMQGCPRRYSALGVSRNRNSNAS
jgi:glycosyltransferase involved in cell wall biosynthesis